MSEGDEKKSESFAELFEREGKAVPKARRLAVGHKVAGVVSRVTATSVFVDLDDRQQAFFDSVDVLGPDGKVLLAPGARVEALVVDPDAGGAVKLGRALTGEASRAQIVAAYEGGVPVEGKVRGVNKGGVEVDIGGVRAFCPISQLDRARVYDASQYLGQTLHFLVTQLKERDVVVSRRAVLEAEAKEGRKRAAERLAVGAIVKGKVTQIREFGAFVDLGDGVEGLVPLRELSHERARAEDVVKLGDVLEVQVKEVTLEGDKPRITLSLKALAVDPWDGIEAIAPVGRVVAGQVSRLQDFGAFIRVAPGVEGLLHVSELGAGVDHPSKVLTVGDPILVTVASVDRDKKRVSLVPAHDGAEAGSAAQSLALVVGQVVKAKVEKVENFGVFVQIEGSRGKQGRALIPNAESGVPRGADLRREFPVGKDVVATVIETGERRLRLSIARRHDDEERAQYDGYRQGQAPPKSMGTFADLLRSKGIK